MTSWASRSSWSTWSTWGGEAGATWGDLEFWGDLSSWFDPTGSAPVIPGPPSITAVSTSSGGVTLVSRVPSTMNALRRVKSSIESRSSTGATHVGPVSQSAANVSAVEVLAPATAMVVAASVQSTVAPYSITFEPAMYPPAQGVPIYYGSVQPSAAPPWLWVTPDGELFYGEPD